MKIAWSSLHLCRHQLSNMNPRKKKYVKLVNSTVVDLFKVSFGFSFDFLNTTLFLNWIEAKHCEFCVPEALLGGKWKEGCKVLHRTGYCRMHRKPADSTLKPAFAD